MKENKKLNERTHDFAAKLKQLSVVDRLKAYVEWQRRARDLGEITDLPDFAPVSINLDLTTACNFACPHCVDSAILNTGEYLPLAVIENSIRNLKPKGILSIILLGGGEPALHKDFEQIVTCIKREGLQLGLVTNGTKLEKVGRVAHLLEQHDWVRLSIDAARPETFQNMHCPKNGITLTDILEKAAQVKTENPHISLGYSFVIVWEGVRLNGQDLQSNCDEMAPAVQLAEKYGFDYVSFKPCLLRIPELERETLLYGVKQTDENRIRQHIATNLKKAQAAASSDIKILESVNLRALLENKVNDLKHQPEVCHMQFFRTVLTPSGIFHCPAFRGVEKAKIGSSDGYQFPDDLNKTQGNLARSLSSFKAADECADIGCFYNHVNWWVERFIQSDAPIEHIDTVANDNFFL
jgi:wyosine [tRNA(Phe)-imidazoG37] synthetase (radical SAM superfamily)